MSKIKLSDGTQKKKKKRKPMQIKPAVKVAIGCVLGAVVIGACVFGFARDYQSIAKKNAYTISANEPATLFASERDAASSSETTSSESTSNEETSSESTSSEETAQPQE